MLLMFYKFALLFQAIEVLRRTQGEVTLVLEGSPAKTEDVNVVIHSEPKQESQKPNEAEKPNEKNKDISENKEDKEIKHAGMLA